MDRASVIRHAARKARRHGGVATIAAITLVLSTTPAVALTPVEVVGGPRHQYSPSSNGTHLAWTTVTGSRSRGRSVYVKELPDGAAERINPIGTAARAAAFVGSSDVVVYTQRRGGDWDLYFYDIASGTRTEAPAPVNGATTEEWGRPMASDQYILFWRQKYSPAGELLNGWLLLYDRVAETMRTLATGLGYYFAGSAGATYVSWTACGVQRWFPHCSAYFWSESGGTVRLAGPQGRNQYAPVIDETDGTIYFVRAVRHACGEKVTIRRADLGSDTSTVLASLPAGIDTDWVQSVARDTSTGHLDLYFDRYRCKQNTGDIYALRGVDTV